MSLVLGFLKTYWPLLVAGLAGAAIAWAPATMLGQAKGEKIAEKRAEAARLVEANAIMKTDGRAKEGASADRVADAVAVIKLKEGLTDAIAALPDEVPSARRVALGCQRLRNSGKDVSGLPACQGSGGSPQAGAAP